MAKNGTKAEALEEKIELRKAQPTFNFKRMGALTQRKVMRLQTEQFELQREQMRVQKEAAAAQADIRRLAKEDPDAEVDEALVAQLDAVVDFTNRSFEVSDQILEMMQPFIVDVPRGWLVEDAPGVIDWSKFESLDFIQARRLGDVTQSFLEQIGERYKPGN